MAHLGRRDALAHQFADLLDDETRLVEIGIAFEDADRLALAGIGPQVLAEALAVVLDQRVGGGQDVAVRAVVLLEADDVGTGVVALEVAHVADLGAAEGVDALVVVADREDLGAATGQQLQPGVLQLVGVLELVDQDVAEALLVVPAERLVALQQFVGSAAAVRQNRPRPRACTGFRIRRRARRAFACSRRRPRPARRARPAPCAR